VSFPEQNVCIGSSAEHPGSIALLAVLGLAVSNTGVPGVTLKPLASDATSVPVVAVTVRRPVAAPAPIEMLAVSVVALATVALFTVIPAPRLTCVVP